MGVGVGWGGGEAAVRRPGVCSPGRAGPEPRRPVPRSLGHLHHDGSPGFLLVEFWQGTSGHLQRDRQSILPPVTWTRLSAPHRLHPLGREPLGPAPPPSRLHAVSPAGAEPGLAVSSPCGPRARWLWGGDTGPAAWEKGAGGHSTGLSGLCLLVLWGRGPAPGRASVCIQQVLDKRSLARMTHSAVQDRVGPLGSSSGWGTTPHRGGVWIWPGTVEARQGPDSGEGRCSWGQLLRDRRNWQVWTWAGLLQLTQNQVHCTCSPGTQLSP